MIKCVEKTKALLWFLLVFVGLWGVLGVAQEAEPREKWALVVSVASYPGLPSHDIPYACADAQAIYEMDPVKWTWCLGGVKLWRVSLKTS